MKTKNKLVNGYNRTVLRERHFGNGSVLDSWKSGPIMRLFHLGKWNLEISTTESRHF